MKGTNILCPSHASTAIVEPSSSTTSSSSSPTLSISSTTHLTTGRSVNRHNPIIRHEKRVPKSFITPPCSNPQHPISPKPYKHHYKSIPSCNNETNKGVSGVKSKNSEQKRKESQGGWGCTKPSSFITPPSSSRYLLNDKALVNVLNDFNPILTLVKKGNYKYVQRDEPSSSSSSAHKVQPPPSSHSVDQVVVLRVSLHCRGCERKMQKHISRMEGVKSFSIDFAAKKLTVVGDVTPLSVLASVSKVKNAILLNSTTFSSSSAPIPPPQGDSSNYMEKIEKCQEIVV